MSAKYAFTKSLKEVRFLFCQSSEQSAAVRLSIWASRLSDLLQKQLTNRWPGLSAAALSRSFLTRAYPTMKKNNPQTPILLREAAGTLPKIYARYEFGNEKAQSLDGLTDKQIEEAVTGLVKNGS
ncbi:NADH-ubiquinone oxidoreductase 10.5 kDa subunit [Paramyrothecium foliicola]|nr:NADH-ubiquinone oxidoreductase 10.5 kDa subunit [Paramyrothecium foliicola]